MKKSGMTHKILLSMIVSFSMLFISCSDEKDVTNPTSSLAFTSYNSKTKECTYTLTTNDETAIKSIYLYKDDSLLYKDITTNRQSVENYATLPIICKYTPDGYKIRAIVEDFGGNTTIDTLCSQVVSTVSSPKSEESWTPNTTQTITWNSNFKDNVNIQLYVDTTYRAFYQKIASNVPNTGKYTWSVPTSLPTGVHFKIRVSCSILDAAECFSDRFTIAPYLMITYPTTSFNLFTGNNLTLSWTNIVKNIKVDLYKGGVFYQNIVNNTSGSSYNWLIPGTLQTGSDYKIRISSTVNESLISETPTFTITAYGSMSDIDGNVYKTITIGTQTWMAENLRTTRYNDGTAIPNIIDVWSTSPAYYWYKSDAATYKTTYGALYNWYAVNTAKLAPTGWHVPTFEEWNTLSTYLGGINVAGAKLKEAGTKHWNGTNTGATNESGFTAMPGGWYNSKGFANIGNDGDWWSSSVSDTGFAFCIEMSSYWSRLYEGGAPIGYGLSVRCVKN